MERKGNCRVPIIQFKGKTAVESYHRVVPHHTLEIDAELSLAKKPSLDGNLIIEGDNLIALKSLLPTHAGRIKCIYIDPMGRETLNEKRYKVADLAPAAKKKFIYEYDFGDGWQHEVVVEKVLPPDPAFKHTTCLAGANACPPDDCGGIPGYYDLLETLENPKHPDHADMKEWIGGEWDAARFDLEGTNRMLKR